MLSSSGTMIDAAAVQTRLKSTLARYRESVAPPSGQVADPVVEAKLTSLVKDVDGFLALTPVKQAEFLARFTGIAQAIGDAGGEKWMAQLAQASKQGSGLGFAAVETGPAHATDVARFLNENPQWKLSDDGSALSRRYQTAGFNASVGFADRAAKAGELHGVLPDVSIRFKDVAVDLPVTPGALTHRDLAAARALEVEFIPPMPPKAGTPPPKAPPPGPTRLDEGQLQAFFGANPQWSPTTDGAGFPAMTATVKLGSPAEVAAFVRQVQDQATASKHHPDVDVRGSRGEVTVTLTTHDSGGISPLDTDFARALSSPSGS